MTAQDAPDRQPGPAPGTVPVDRLGGVRRTGGIKPAALSADGWRRQKHLQRRHQPVAADQAEQNLAYHFTSTPAAVNRRQTAAATSGKVFPAMVLRATSTISMLSFSLC